MLSIRWHGRAGQGALTGSKGLAKIFFLLGKEVQAFAFYGSAKRGASMTAYNRVSDKAITNHEKAMVPDYVFVIDEDLVTSEEILAHTTDNTKYILSTFLSKEELIAKQPKLEGKEIYIADCTKIARETIGRPIPNTPMLGAFMKISQEVDIEKFKRLMKEKVLLKFTDKIINANLESIDRAYKEVV
jgi:pyruvate ferredoxin oxidoreductase gamma subunit